MGIVRTPHLFVTLTKNKRVFSIFRNSSHCYVYQKFSAYMIGKRQKNEKMLLFNKESLSLCKKTFQLRKYYKFKYGNVELPDENDETHGYNMKYCKKFTALSKPQIKKSKQDYRGSHNSGIWKKSTDSLLRSEVTLPKFSRRPACSVIDWKLFHCGD